MPFSDSTFDTRHNLPTAARRPQEVGGKPKMYVYRCAVTPEHSGCGRLMSNEEWKRYGKCTRCGNIAVRGTGRYVPWTYILRHYFWGLLGNWRTLGDNGWGWKTSFWKWIWNQIRGKRCTSQ